MELRDISFDKALAIYKKFFSVYYLNSNLGDKLAVIALTCSITNELRKKNKDITCYDVLLKIGKDFGKEDKETFLKSLGVICEDFMYGVKEFPDYGVPLKDMPKQLQKLLDSYVPF